jgi:hypothetical protein
MMKRQAMLPTSMTSKITSTAFMLRTYLFGRPGPSQRSPARTDATSRRDSEQPGHPGYLVEDDVTKDSRIGALPVAASLEEITAPVIVLA